jgi:hypothetical protein
MKIFGSISRLVSIVFRRNAQDITLSPNNSTTYVSAATVELPPGVGNHELVSANSTQTLTNKTLTAPVIATISNSGTLTVPSGLTDTFVLEAATQTLTNKTIDADTNTISNIENGDIKTGAAIDAAKIADGSVSSAEFQYLSGVTSDIQTQFTGKQATSEKGNANGYASLDGGGKVPASQLPSSLMDFLGAWNASTNSPALADGTGNSGDVYRVSAAGTQDLGSGNQTFAIGDWVMYNGSIWQHSPGTDAVTSVNSLTGAVVLDTDDIAEGTAQYFTTERAQDAVGAALTDTASVDFTYNDGANTIEAVVLPAGVDHDALSNYVANKHVDHTAVSISTATDSGLAGGGDISATRTITIDPTNAPAATVAGGDLLLIADISAANALKKVTAQSIADLAAGSAAQAFTWTDGSTSKVCTHTFATNDVLVELYDSTSLETVYADVVDRTGTNEVTITRSEATVGSNWRVVIRN